MNRTHLKTIFPIIAFLLLIPWPVAYAHDVSGGQGAVQVEAAEASAKPAWMAFGGAVGGLNAPQELFYVDASNSAADFQVALHITNTQELAQAYRYLILEVGVCREGKDGGWEETGVRDTYITLRNGRVSFFLPGYARYRLSIRGGSFYSYGAPGDGAGLTPNFYLEIN